MSTDSDATPEDDAGGELTEMQARFVSEYLRDLNGTQAAIRAGYAPRSADVTACRLLTKARIEAAIAEARAARSARTAITTDRVLQELSILAFSDVTNYEVDDHGKLTLKAGAPRRAHRAIQSVKHKIITTPNGDVYREVEIKLWNKPGPLELAGRHVGLFDDKKTDDEPRETHIHINGVMPVPPELAGEAPSPIGPETTTTGGKTNV